MTLAAQLLDAMQAAGAQPVAPDILQPADTLLDLYGEDIRARAYVTQDPSLGEMMLRPDFTVPVVEAHMREGAEPARYCYAGPVFRKQQGARAREYLQVGYELFARDDPARADAEVFALFTRLLAGHGGVRPVTGDIGILKAAVAGLSTTDTRKAALMRHIWRPARFRALLDRMGGQGPLAAARAELIAGLDGPTEALIEAAGPLVGLRDADEIAARIERLRVDASAPPIPRAQVAAIEALLTLRAPARAALAEMRAQGWAALSPALDRLEARLDALDAAGIDSTALPFEASFGRTTMEYYDGFVFGFIAEGRAIPPVATGGRYDALTAVLGAGRAIPAVGGVIRPALLEALEC